MHARTRAFRLASGRSRRAGCAGCGVAWRGYDYHYHPCTGQALACSDDTVQAFAVDARDDGVYVALPPEAERERTVSDVLVETMVNWGVTSVFGMVGHSNLGFADAMRCELSRSAAICGSSAFATKTQRRLLQAPTAR